MQYTEFSITLQGDLHIGLTSNGKSLLQNLLVEHGTWNDDEVFLELIDEHLAQNWQIVPPDQIRATRKLLILSDSVQYDKKGNINHIDSAYWHPNDQLGIVSKILLEQGYVIFEKGH
jgi:hypothetical protein